MLTTPLCGSLGISVPIVQAPVGSATGPSLAAAVSEAGGLGTLALTWHNLEHVREIIRSTRALTTRPIAANLVLDQLRERNRVAHVAACLEEGITALSLSWGDAAPYVALAHDAGVLVMHTVSTAAEARRSADAGVDILVAQGWEAGGHVSGTVSTLALVPRVADEADGRPVVAAGGIADGRGLAAVLALGASGAWIGTRFLLAAEAGIHPVYRDALLSASETDTAFTVLFDGGWPDAPHRTLRNSTVRAWEMAGRPASGQRAGEGEVVAHTAEGRPVERYSDTIPRPGMHGDVEALAMYAGQGVGLVTLVQPAAAIVAEIVRDAEIAMRRFVR